MLIQKDKNVSIGFIFFLATRFRESTCKIKKGLALQTQLVEMGVCVRRLCGEGGTLEDGCRVDGIDKRRHTMVNEVWCCWSKRL